MSCEGYASSPVKMVNGVFRLVTPKVSLLASRHFACDADDFGPALQTVVLLLLALLFLTCAPGVAFDGVCRSVRLSVHPHKMSKATNEKST